VEESFALGMRYMDTPMTEGYCKALVNFDLKDAGAVLIPRAGYQLLHDKGLGDYTDSYAVHHTAQGNLRNTATNEDQAKRYILFEPANSGLSWFSFADSLVLMEQSFTSDYADLDNKQFAQVPVRIPTGEVSTQVTDEAVGTGDASETEFTLDFTPSAAPVIEVAGVTKATPADYSITDDVITFTSAPANAEAITATYTHDVTTPAVFKIKRIPRVRTQLLHNISLTDQNIFNGTTQTAAYTMLSNVAILPVEYTAPGAAAVNGFARLYLKTDNGSTYYAELIYLTPAEISPTEAVNYGYNMLDDDPYTFVDSIGAAVSDGYIIMEGILPYAEPACTNLKFKAKVGEEITFKLVSQFHDNTDTFKFRWELRELGSEDVTVYQDQDNSACPEQSMTTGVTLTCRPPFKQFSITVVAFSTDDLTEPLQVMTLASYTMGDDTPGSSNQIAVAEYPLDSATDLCTWKQHIVLWGVRGAANLIFVSEVNNPTYFPYPNNANVFEEAVVACVPYLNDLLVFTESKLYRCAWSGDGLTYNVDMIQDKLFMSAFDKETITIVQNMVFFKNGNYFYMVVPKASSSEPGALQLAPISTPITNLLDEFQTEVARTFRELYNPENGGIFPPLLRTATREIVLHDYYNYLDTSIVRNVYKFRLVDRDRTSGLVVNTLLYFDFVLNYDTVTRAWTSYMLQSNGTRLWPYRQNVTDTTIYINTLNTPIFITEEDDQGVVTSSVPGYASSCCFVKPNVLDPEDVFPLAGNTTVKERLLKNHQYLDTGYREHNSQTKKRYREIQFKINNRGQSSLMFGTEFLIDDNLRKPLYQYATRHITDPNSADYGYLYVERIVSEPLVSVGAAILDDEDTPQELYMPATIAVPSQDIVLQSNCWVLDVSQLSQVAVSKIRFRVSGKGYSPRLILLSFNDKPYEMMSHNWVYRGMNAR